MATLESIQIGVVQDLEVPTKSLSQPKRIVKSAIQKSMVFGPQRVSELGLVGDQQAEAKIHGGIDKALLAYCSDHYPFWKSRVNRDIQHGAFGENLTVSGIDETNVCVGDQLRIGQCVLEVSQPRQPCFKLSAYWQENQMMKWVKETSFSGWYLRVLEPGLLEAGQSIDLVARPNPKWTIQLANQLMFGQVVDAVAMTELYLLPELANDWKKDLG